MTTKPQAVRNTPKRVYRISNVAAGLFAIFMWIAGYATAMFVVGGAS